MVALADFRKYEAGRARKRQLAALRPAAEPMAFYERHDQAAVITGQRHVRTDRECFCGCKAVIDCTGYIVKDSDTPKLATLDLLIAEFPDVPFHSGPVQIAYSYSELGLTRPAPEPAHHETVRLFEPAPAQIPGQLAF